MEFECSLGESQIEQGGRVLFEHPWTATSWNEPCLGKLLANDGMRKMRCDQCHFGMTSFDGAGNVGAAQKATKIMTNDVYIADAVNRRCFGGRNHIQLLSGRAKACEKYPPRLVVRILRALRQEYASRGMRRSARLAGKGPTADNRSDGCLTDSGRKGAAVTSRQRD